MTSLLGYIDPGVSGIGNLLTPINPTSISFEGIKTDLVDWALAKPANVAWKDWFETDDGTIIAEWIAGLAVFRKIAETMRQREASLDYAQLESSIYELAFNRGLLVPPSAAPVETLYLTVPAGATVTVNVGDLVGMQGSYDIYSLEGKTLVRADTLSVAVGHLNTFTPTFSTLGKFSTFQVPLKDRYVATALESLIAGGKSIPLVAEPLNIGGFSNSFVLRRAVPSQVRLYIGNGTLGWYDASVNAITYTCLSYGQDVLTSLTYAPNLVINAVVTSFTETIAPSFDPDKETLRSIARYYPIDGRIVQSSDYEAVIRKYYGGVLYDVLSYNSDPDQQVYLLPNANYGYGTSAAALQLAAIQEMVDSKRGLGIEIVYTVVPPSAGLTFHLTFAVPAASFNFALQQQVTALTASQLNQFARTAVTLTSVDFATQLSARFGVRFRPIGLTASLTLAATDFLSSFTIGLVSG